MIFQLLSPMCTVEIGSHHAFEIESKFNFKVQTQKMDPWSFFFASLHLFVQLGTHYIASLDIIREADKVVKLDRHH